MDEKGTQNIPSPQSVQSPGQPTSSINPAAQPAPTAAPDPGTYTAPAGYPQAQYTSDPLPKTQFAPNPAPSYTAAPTAQPQHGYPQYTQQTQYGQPQYAQPQYTAPQQPQYAQPQYAAPQQPQYAQPQYTAPQQPQYAQPQYTAPQQPQYAQPQYTAPQQPQYAQPQYAAPQQPQYAQPQGRQKGGRHSGGPGGPKKPAKWLIPLIASLVVLGIVGGVVALILSNRSDNRIMRATAATIDHLSDSSLAKLSNDLAKGGSIAISFDGRDIMRQMVGISASAQADMKLYMDSKNSRAAIEFTADIMGSAIDFAAYGDESNVAVSSKALFGNGAYGLDLSNIAKDLDKSIFGPNGDYYIGDEAYDLITETFGSLMSSKDAQKLMENGMDLAEEYGEFLIKTVLKYAEIEQDKDTVRFGSERVDVTTYDIVINGEAAYNIAKDVLEKVNKDKDLKAFLYDLVATMPEGTVAGDIDDIYDELEWALEDLEDSREYMIDSDEELKLEVYIKGSALAGFKFAVDDSSMVMLIGPDPTEPTYISFEYEDYWDTFSMVYSVKEDSKDAFKASFTAMDEYGDGVIMSVDWDKADGDYTADINVDGEAITLKGKLIQKKDVYTLTFDKVSVSGYGYVPDEVQLVLQAITVTIDTDDTAPKVPSYTNILKMDEDDFMDLYENIQEFMSSSMMRNLFY